MNVPKAGQNQHMQRSHRTFIVAGISAVVMLGSADGALALDTLLSDTLFEKDTDKGVIQLQRAQKLKRHQINHIEYNSFNANPDLTVLDLTTFEPTPLPSSESTDAFAENELSQLESPQTSPILLAQSSIPQETSVPIETTSNNDSDAYSDAYSIDPELRRSVDQLLASAEVLAAEYIQSNETRASRTTAVASPEQMDPPIEFTQNELAQEIDVEETPSDASQGDAPELEVFEENIFEDDGLESDGLDEGVVEEDLIEGDAIEADDPRSTTDPDDIDPDREVLTEAEALIAPPPDYLLSNPNPLYVPTRPEDVDLVGTQPITLEQSLELARQNSRDLQNAILTLEGARADLREAQAERFPTLSVGTDITHTDLNPATEPTGPFGEPVEVDNNTTTLTGDVTLSYDLFTSGGRNASIRAAERAVRLQELQVEVITEDIRQDVTTAYYDLQQSDEEIRIAQADLEEALTSLRDAEARERAGVGTRFDRLQAEVEVANSQQSLRIAISNQQIARRTLADLLSLPSGMDVSAADEVEVAGIWPLTLEESIVTAFRNRAEPEQQLVQREIDQQQRRVARSQTLPQISVFGRYQFNDLLDETRGPSDNESLSVGAQLTWLLFDGGASRAAARGEKIDEQIAETNFADSLEAIRLQVETAYSQLGANFENIQTAQTAVAVAEESLRLARLRFQAGVGIQSDVITAQADLTDAELNLVTAILDYNRALVDIQRAVSNLDGNLSNVP